MTYFLKPFCPECGCRSLIRTNESKNEYYCQKCGQRVYLTDDELIAVRHLCFCNESDAVFGEENARQYRTKDEFYYAVHQEVQEIKKIREENKKKREEKEKSIAEDKRLTALIFLGVVGFLLLMIIITAANSGM